MEPARGNCASDDASARIGLRAGDGIDDATMRGWQREIERHPATKARIERLLTDLHQS